jgi:DNA-3-methyladenine glycosylase II
MKITYDLQHPNILALNKKDPKLLPLFEIVGSLTVELFQPHFPFFIFTIIGQQLSTKVVDVLYQRLESYLGALTPVLVFAADDEDLFNLGLSRRKIQTMKIIAEAAMKGDLDAHHFEHQTPEKITQHLTAYKGIGPWTADMFMMFSLGHMDHFSILDLGLVKAYQKLFGPASLEAIKKDALNWRPFRSIVAHYLWAYWDNF